MRNYLCDPERKRDLFERLREEHRDAALQIVAVKRAGDQETESIIERPVDEGPGDQADSMGRRLRMEMLGDAERGLSAEEIAQLTGLQVGSVRNYLYTPDRKKDLFERVRAEHRDAALRIVAGKRA